MEHDDACCVCLQATDSLTPCKHRLCKTCCWELWRNACPVCRAKLPPEGLGPRCAESDGESDDSELIPMRRTSGVAHERRQHAGGWQFELPYSSDWYEVRSEKLRDLGISMMEYRRHVTVVDCFGQRVNLATATPSPDHFPLTFSAPALEESSPLPARAEVYEEMLDAERRRIQPSRSGRVAAVFGSMARQFSRPRR
eukprot:TRINITY_DN53161_c0_g1_i1.p2 TRINITY_DN53161_c0_g1~~TRINITY_DN53161_c0_g1_i1.p2  ORF type:complete len:206 (+),score=28.04 TRINITY_DN53161_c0_g1_i1:28-618(+)